MGYIEVSNLTYVLPGGRVLLEDVSLRVPENSRVALVGANGVGKSTLLRVIAGEAAPVSGQVRHDGHLRYMRQFVVPDPQTRLRDFLLSQSEQRLQSAARELRSAERWMRDHNDRESQVRYAAALTAWGEAGGYEAEVLWDKCTTAAMDKPLDAVADRPVGSLSGGEQKRLALELLLRSDADVLLLDEPDNFLDIPGKQWLEASLNASPKTILYVSHDRALLAETSQWVVTLEGHSAWTHPESFATYAEARARRLVQIEEEQRLYEQEHARLVAVMREFKRRAATNPKFARRATSMEGRIERFERDSAPRERPQDQQVKMRLEGGRTGKVALRGQGLSFPGLVAPFDFEIWYGDRVGVVGANGTGKSHFLKLLAGENIRHGGAWSLGARVTPNMFSQLHDRPDIEDIPLMKVLSKRGLERGPVMTRLKRYGLHTVADLPFSLLSGGQQARFQILLMEIDNATLLLLDEPTDNLDVDSAEALEEALTEYQGTVIAVTHDRWFMLLLDRFLVFNEDGTVTESLTSPYLSAASGG